MYLSSDSVWFDLILTTGVGGLLCVTLQHGRVMDVLLNCCALYCCGSIDMAEKQWCFSEQLRVLREWWW